MTTDPAMSAMSVAEADALLTGPSGPFAITRETVLGREMDVVPSPHRNLRSLLAASAGHGGDGSGRYYLFDDGRSASFAENVDHAASVAAGLADRYGIGPGDRVGLLGANQPPWIQAFWGTVSTGAIAVAMNGWWKGDEIRYAIKLTEPTVLVADRRRFERLDGDPGVPTVVMDCGFNDLMAAYRGASLPEVDIAPDDPAAILFTSGTTGRPRGAVQTHRNFLAYVSCAFMIGARKAVRFPGAAPVSSGPTLACSPLFHVSGLHACAVIAVASGTWHVWTTGRFDAEKILRLTQEHRIARWGGVTTQIWRLIEHPKLAEYDTSSVISVGGGGSMWSPELQQACRARLPAARSDVSVGYGLTESSGLAASASDDVLRDHPDCVGYPLPTVKVRITDDEGNELPDGAVGNVCISSDVVMPGYWNDPAATAETIRDGWLRTGDYGHLADGLLFLTGRRSDLIIRGGENIYPAEIEHRLDSHPRVLESAVFGVDHRELGQEVKAVVVLSDETAPDTTAGFDGAAGPERTADRDKSGLVEEFKSWVAETLADMKVPVHWELCPDPLPRNAAGKVLKHVLRGEADSIFVEE